MVGGAWGISSRERRLLTVLREQAWSIACSEASWEASLSEQMREFLAGDEFVHVVRFARGDQGELRVTTWMDAPARPTDVLTQRDSVLDDPWKHPGIQAVIERGTTSPIRLSDIVDLPRFRHTEIFERVHAYPHGTRFASAAALVSTPRELVLLGCHSTKKDFSCEHMEMLARLQRVIASALVIRTELGRLAAVEGELVEPGAAVGQRGAPPGLPLPNQQVNDDYWPTSREQQVLGLLVLGLTSRQIARRMEITERTVRKHLESVYRKAGLSGRVATAAWWQARAPVNRIPG